ncbi:MAG TPA: hypothetical protein VGM75_11875 [Pseudonocardiaceae bacterium]|jgi:hypothetical protein
MTGHDDADRLAEANLAYRRPSLYDELTAGDELAHTVARVASDLGVTVGTVLDLGAAQAETWPPSPATGGPGWGSTYRPPYSRMAAPCARGWTCGSVTCAPSDSAARST